MYGEVWDLLFYFLHFIFSVYFVLIVSPRIIWIRNRSSSIELTYSNYIAIVFFLIIVGYLFVILKIFEVIALVLLMLLFTFRNRFLIQSRETKEQIIDTLNTTFYDFTDGKVPLKNIFWNKLKRSAKELINKIIARFSNLQTATVTILFFLIIAISAYIRFYDAFMYPQPPMSDGYVTLAWMKYINQRILFHDGIYPQGFHISLAVIQKFAAIDSLLVLKFVGPLNSMLTLFGFYFFVSRISGNRIAGIISSLLYGLLSYEIFGVDIERQVATNSQEFALVFIFPALYFFFQYICHRRQADLWTAFFGLSVIGFVHSFVFVFAGLGILSLLAASFLIGRKDALASMVKVVIYAGISVVFSVLPLLIGKLMGRELHGSSAEYLTTTIDQAITFPLLKWFDYIAIWCIILILLYVVFVKVERRISIFLWFTVIFSTGIFTLYYFGAVITQSMLIASRSPLLWGMTVPVTIGAAWFVLFQMLKLPVIQKQIQVYYCLAVFAGSLLVFPVQPSVPYKLESAASVAQYIRMNEQFAKKNWLMISQSEGYALALGNGFHMYVKDLLEQYDPTQKALTKKGESKPSIALPNDMFIYYEKNIFQVDEDNSVYPLLKPEYERREKEMVKLKKWLATYQKYNQDMKIFYEDKDLQIIHLHRPLDRDEQFKKIWGGS